MIAINEKLDKVLRGLSSAKILIPENVVLDTTLNKYRVAVLCYLNCKTGMDNLINFSIKWIIDWLSRTTHDRRIKVGYSNPASMIVECLKEFNKTDYFFYDDELKFATIAEGIFDKDKYREEFTGQRFAKIYLDELENIINYKDKDSDSKIDPTLLLLVFAYLRMRIPVKNDLAGAGKRPDAYDTNYNIIGDELGISERLVSKAIKTLVNMGLIYEYRRGIEIYYTYDNHGQAIKHRKEKSIIFCNTYKRIEKGGKTYLIEQGEKYYLSEVSDKEDELEEMNSKKNSDNNR